jgi:large subunit ribosomal protein L9
MEVILKKDVENLGFQDDLLEVKNGYARNYLIPQGFAMIATVSAKKVLAETLRQRAHRDEKLIKDAKKVAKTLEEVTIKIISKTGDGAKLFGSVNNANIAEALEKQGHSIDKKFIKIDGNNVKRVGKYVAHIRLHRELIVDMPFEVVAEPSAKPKKEKVVVEVAPEEKVVEVVQEEVKQSIDDVIGQATSKKAVDTESNSEETQE